MPRCRARASRLLAVCVVVGAATLAPTAELRFLRDDVEVRRIDREMLRRSCAERVVTVRDPYYEAVKRFRACPLTDVLRLGFGEAPRPGDDVVFRAHDGYAKPSTGARVAMPGGWVAFADADREEGFAPLGRQHVDPGPFYLVWDGPGQDDPHLWPWPYQLAEIVVTDVTRRWPRIVPRNVAHDSAAWRGFTIFRSECVACHAINGQGGTVGPELNVPRNILEYREPEQLKAFIRDPAAFRYGNMPPNPHLSPEDLEGLIAYFATMQRQKHDPRTAP